MKTIARRDRDEGGMTSTIGRIRFGFFDCFIFSFAPNLDEDKPEVVFYELQFSLT